MKNENILLIGDSITEGFNTSRFLSGLKVINKGVSGDSTVECLQRIEKNWFEDKPGLIFICIGTNDFARDRSDEIILENISGVIIKVKTYSRVSNIVITSLFPTRDNPPRPNSRINLFNKKLKELSAENNCLFFDLHKDFIDPEGNLKAEFTEDGLHLTEPAYKHWAEKLIIYIQSL